ncbi:MAG: nucleotidyltransferase family protein [Clostridia bacterium]|nr:nucleotidyltransferase family protein [Clostridia bacterium]
MMKTTAVICELNPIHPGHRLVLRLCENANDITIAVMSGNFTQRGIPAVYEKYTRAETAVRCGADLVVELPFPWCSSGVEAFALGGVRTAAGCLAQSLTFGSESGDFALLERIAELKASEKYADAVREAERESRGRGTAVLFDEIMQKNGIAGETGANDKLGGEYIRFGRLNGIEEFRPVKRMQDAPSATAVREVLGRDGLTACGNWLAEEAYPVFARSQLCPEILLDELYFTHCRLYVREDEENDLLRYAAKMARTAVTAAEFIEKLPTKKYTLARMRREILYAILRVKPEDYKNPPAFTVLLAANEKGRAYLADCGKHFTVPVITKPADFSALDETGKRQYELHRKADELYAYLMGWPADTFIKRHPVIL